MMIREVFGNIVDIHSEAIFPGKIVIDQGLIIDIVPLEGNFPGYIIPGLIDAHVHIESSMLTPAEFSRVAIRQGTVATVSDPHEIANVLGVEGVRFMIENGRLAKLKFHWAIPSCVPATDFETSGARINASDIRDLLSLPHVVALAEMMNYPGVIYNDPGVLEKISVARNDGFPVDGHAPGLGGDDLKKYVGAGISTDHECSTLDEALEKIQLGMKILIRNGSSAKNFDALCSLIDSHPEDVMLCTDDSHPEDLLNGHMNVLLKMGIEHGLHLFNLLNAATANPVKHYGLKVGLLRKGDPADFCVMEDLKEFRVLQTWINGEEVFHQGIPAIDPPAKITPVNHFAARKILARQLKVEDQGKPFKVIEVADGSLITGQRLWSNSKTNGFVGTDPKQDLLKIVVINRYQQAEPAVGFIHGFGLKQGALASTVAHDSHNLIAIGVNDEELLNAVNALMEMKGGLVAVSGSQLFTLPLEVGGLMSVLPAEEVADRYLSINHQVKAWGSPLKSPLMTLSFMALLVIPELKIGDKGLFDVGAFRLTSLFS